MSSTSPVRPTLANDVVELRPLVPGDAPDLFAALDDPRVWALGYGGGPAARPGDVGEMARFMATALTAGTGGVAWTVRTRGSGTVVGTSSLGDVDLVNESAHLGWTAYSPAVWGGVVNPATKVAILTYAFDDLGLGRVKLQVDHRNERSQAAVERLGAVREGVARRDRRRADGTFRDSVIYSILRDEWPAVRGGLSGRVAAALAAGGAVP